MSSIFTADFFKNNRRRVREAAPCELLVITANGLMQRGGDSSYPFEQDANFWYVTGLSEPDLVLVLDGNREYLIVPGRSESRQAFDGALAAEALADRSGIEMVYDEQEGWSRLDLALKRHKRVGTPAVPQAYIEQLGLYTNPTRQYLLARLQQRDHQLGLVDLNPVLWRLRCLKQPMELQALQQAIDVTIETLQEVAAPRRLARFHYEYELEAALTQGFRSRGTQGHAFDPIVAGGKHATTLHYVANNDRLHQKELVVLDVGAQAEQYAADISRTYCLGKPSARQQAVYDAVLATHTHARTLLKPGVLIKEYEQQVRQFLGQQLKSLGLITQLDETSIRQYYPHATSHFLGLNVHDVGDYAHPLEPNMVLTVEPGIYIPEEGIGVRIEDDVVITEKGIKVLSEALPRRLS